MEKSHWPIPNVTDRSLVQSTYMRFFIRASPFKTFYLGSFPNVHVKYIQWVHKKVPPGMSAQQNEANTQVINLGTTQSAFFHHGNTDMTAPNTEKEAI